jgi:hypothetical protein
MSIKSKVLAAAAALTLAGGSPTSTKGTQHVLSDDR